MQVEALTTQYVKGSLDLGNHVLSLCLQAVKISQDETINKRLSLSIFQHIH
jgi:hypothetical protein